jgi:hypothetical protein
LNLTRRSVLAGIAGSIASAFALDPERALWIPGAKLISIPKPRAPQRYRFPAQMILTEQFYNSFRKPGLAAEEIERDFYLKCIAPLEVSVMNQVERFSNENRLRPNFVKQETDIAGVELVRGFVFGRHRSQSELQSKQHTVPNGRVIIAADVRTGERILQVDCLVEA